MTFTLGLFFYVCLYDRHLYLQFIVSSQSCNSGDLESSDKSNAAKRRKMLIAEKDEVSVKCVENKSAAVTGGDGGGVSF